MTRYFWETNLLIMRKLMMKMSVSVDGFVGAADGRIDWIFSTTDEEATAWIVGLCRSAGLHIMGSKTFQDMASYWPTSTEAFAAPMNEVPKALFTKKGFKGIDQAQTTTAVENSNRYNAAHGVVPCTQPSPAAASWAEARVFDGDLAEGIRKLKAEPGNPILAHGGAGFMRSLIATGLIDEYNLLIHPTALGAGMPIFNGLSKPLDLKLVDVKVFPAGAVAHTYRI
jgi:dihydrofolate reductase